MLWMALQLVSNETSFRFEIRSVGGQNLLVEIRISIFPSVQIISCSPEKKNLLTSNKWALIGPELIGQQKKAFYQSISFANKMLINSNCGRWVVNGNGHVLRALEIAHLKINAKLINVRIQVSGISLESCQIIYWKARPCQIYIRRMLRLATVKILNDQTRLSLPLTSLLILSETFPRSGRNAKCCRSRCLRARLSVCVVYFYLLFQLNLSFDRWLLFYLFLYIFLTSVFSIASIVTHKSSGRHLMATHLRMHAAALK